MKSKPKYALTEGETLGAMSPKDQSKAGPKPKPPGGVRKPVNEMWRTLETLNTPGSKIIALLDHDETETLIFNYTSLRTMRGLIIPWNRVFGWIPFPEKREDKIEITFERY